MHGNAERRSCGSRTNKKSHEIIPVHIDEREGVQLSKDDRRDRIGWRRGESNHSPRGTRAENLAQQTCSRRLTKRSLSQPRFLLPVNQYFISPIRLTKLDTKTVHCPKGTAKPKVVKLDTGGFACR